MSQQLDIAAQERFGAAANSGDQLGMLGQLGLAFL